MQPNPTALDLLIRLSNIFDNSKPVVVDTGDGIFKIDRIEEQSHEVFIFLGEMP